MNDPAGVSIDNLCRPSSSPRAIAAGCTGDASAGACEACSGGFFLFMGGCYSTKSTSGSEICTAASGGKCTTCNAANGLFKNPAASPTLGSECILCSDITSRDGVMGVENCNKCTAPAGNTGAATCSACQDGYYKDSNGACKVCNGCATCTAANTCTSCPEGKYLKDTGCVDNTCGGDNTYYPDPVSGKCISCSASEGGITDCDTCTYDAALQGPKCLTCTSSGGTKLLKTELDGAVTCVEEAQCTAGSTHFKTDNNQQCLPCSDPNTSGSTNDQGKEGCMTCTKTNGSSPICSACLSGYYGTSTCTKCAANCATCSEAVNANKCESCYPGYFLVTEGASKKCIPCSDTAKGGIDGCAECSGTTGSLKCAECKPNYKQSGPADSVICTKTCEDPTACGGTAGSCKAAVLDDKGAFRYCCSLCGQSNYVPIDGKCVDKTNNANGNTCANGVCAQCAASYFLYMG